MKIFNKNDKQNICYPQGFQSKRKGLCKIIKVIVITKIIKIVARIFRLLCPRLCWVLNMYSESYYLTIQTREPGLGEVIYVARYSTDNLVVQTGLTPSSPHSLTLAHYGGCD